MSSPSALTPELAGQFARIALGHVTREYPHKLDHVWAGPEDSQSPRAQHPIFYGSFDWHSCIHGYWLLATVRRLCPGIAEAAAIDALFAGAFSPAKVEAERAYLDRPTARGFERPYGWAWALMLQAELSRHSAPWSATFAPLADAFADRFRAFLPKADYPVRTGVHSSTAFALALASEYAGVAPDLLPLLREKAQAWYGQDRDCQAWEPSGDDFLSPALIEAEAMRRLLNPVAFRDWFARFLPNAEQGLPATLFIPTRVSDRSDGKIAHLDGVNLSRAWCWRSIASCLPPHFPLRAHALTAAETHLAAGLPHVAGDYMGEHWLATFALLALTAPADRP